MKANIVAIGNSQGIRIPKILLDQSGLSGEVDLEVCDQGIMIRKSKRPRENWDEAFQQMAQNNDDDMLIEGSSPKTLRENWRW
ncbi:MAG: AbrB/MazE/SpoVT family DNA-binding domain-containing protein [Acidobacteria bacterium]|nr:AbrB/MazE/SpoVT family DNA-binding domain-containing protein [Acidobacteriota bacterium]